MRTIIKITQKKTSSKSGFVDKIKTESNLEKNINLINHPTPFPQGTPPEIRAFFFELSNHWFPLRRPQPPWLHLRLFAGPLQEFLED